MHNYRPPTKLIAYMYANIFQSEEGDLLVRLPVISPVTCLFTDCMYKWNCLHLGEIFVTFYALMLTPSMPTRWGLTATLQ